MPNNKRQLKDETCELYLFGELSLKEQMCFEETYFADDEFFFNFLAVKDALIDSYVRDEMTQGERVRFLKHFSFNSFRRRQIEELKDFIDAITRVFEKK